MKLPFSFKEFVKSPFAAIALLCIVGMGYLYVDARSAQTDIIKDCRKSEQNKIERITKLEKDVADLQTKIIELATRTREDQ